MLAKALAVGAVSLLVVPVAFAGARSARSIGRASGAWQVRATLTSDKAGAHPVGLTIQLHGELECGRLPFQALTVGLPAAMHVVGGIPRSSVLVGGKTGASVAVHGSAIQITVPPLSKPGVICHVLGPGTVSIAIARSAGLRNPRRPGSYPFSVAVSPHGWRWVGVLKIR